MASPSIQQFCRTARLSHHVEYYVGNFFILLTSQYLDL